MNFQIKVALLSIIITDQFENYSLVKDNVKETLQEINELKWILHYAQCHPNWEINSPMVQIQPTVPLYALRQNLLKWIK